MALVPPPLPLPTCIPLPRISQEEIWLNSLLAKSYHILLQYDVTTPPSTAICIDPWRINSAWMCEPATYPPTSSLTIRLGSRNGRPIVIHSSFVTAVTVWDVIAGVHQALRDRVHKIYGCPKCCSPLGREVEMEIKMIQLAGNNRIWAGLAESDSEWDVWILDLI
ncbi:hypothetical protein BDQ12DRAFT_744523 [Crucibulum laeve]|uniref:DUF6699 domain-containing protein n=1 Tax=Crucibulum laeve TaxID=68775 RepID=A0A5C3M1T5_9AGAR|nr:hypothetical protein BDQ12DRAFT_744523 [Crucibulum laeve]